MPASQVKPFDIPKQQVWEAYRRVAANKGAPGVDGQTLAAFEEDLKNNLYKIWNRMSSGSYFPPPVKGVEIPKSHGGVRMLGVPTDPANCEVAPSARGFGIVPHGHSSVSSVGRSTAAGVVRAPLQSDGSVVVLRGRAGGHGDAAGGVDRPGQAGRPASPRL